MAKRYAGIKVPNKEVNAMYFHLPCGIAAKLINPMIKRNNEQKIIRSDPNWNGFNATNPFFINMNELPQIRASTISSAHFNCCDFISRNFKFKFCNYFRNNNFNWNFFCIFYFD